MPPRVRTQPRKSPSQARSQATVEAILGATARVLTRLGYDRASTNRIAEVASVEALVHRSVGRARAVPRDVLVGALVDLVVCFLASPERAASLGGVPGPGRAAAPAR